MLNNNDRYVRDRYSVGKRDRIITLMHPDVTTGTSYEDKFSGTYSNFSTDPNPYAWVRHKPGIEMVRSDQIVHVQVSTFVIPYRTDVSIKDVVLLDEKMYQILSFNEYSDVREKLLLITAEYLREYT